MWIRYALVNDFEAVGHAVAQADDAHFAHLCGPDAALPEAGTISIIGPGTGLGVAHIWRGGGGYHVQATEGGHIDFAPLDGIEDALLARLRKRYRRVSVERVVSGPGLVDIYEALAALEGRPVAQLDDKALWPLAMSGGDSLAAAALDRFCLTLGSVAGDIALAQGGGERCHCRRALVCASRIISSAPALPNASAPKAALKRLWPACRSNSSHTPSPACSAQRLPLPRILHDDY